VMLVVVGAPLGHPGRHRPALRSMITRSPGLTSRTRSPGAVLAGADRTDLRCGP
jgi:hypothetical protein